MNDIVIRYADDSDLEYLVQNDNYVTEAIVKKKILDRQLIICLKDKTHVGWLRFGFFWDTIPFMNLIFFIEDARRKGYGRKLVAFWEKEMWVQGFKMVISSTNSDEEAQHFYRKLGYRDCGLLLLPRDLFPNESSELFLVKIL